MLKGYQNSVTELFDNVTKQNKKLLSKDINSKTHHPTDDQADKQTVRQAVTHSDSLSDRHSGRQSDTHTDRQPLKHSGKHTDNQSIKHTIEHSTFKWMSDNQRTVYTFLINNKQRITRYKDISYNTNVPYGTVRGVIQTLTKEKLITKPTKYRKGMYQGFSYTVDENLSLEFLNLINTQSNTLDSKHSDRHSDSLSIRHAPYSSSSFKKLTTEKINLFQTDIEFVFWRDNNLSINLIDKWLGEFNVSEVQLLQSLKFARYDLIENEKIEKLNKNNPVNWFYGAIKKNGGLYTKPSNYKTVIELKIEEEDRYNQEMLKQLEELKKKKEEGRAIKAEIWFYNLSEEEQKKLIRTVKGLTPAQLRNYDSAGTKAAIRRLFDEHNL